MKRLAGRERAAPLRAHMGFKNEVGKTLAGAEVLGRAANINGNARWNCKLACGHLVIVPGIVLRAAEKEGRTLQCVVCRPKRPGTVVRRG